MICKNCNKEIKSGNKFCNYCGKEVLADTPSAEVREKEIRIVFTKSLAFKIAVGVFGLLLLYIIFADKPFSFFTDDREIDQGVLTSSVVNVLCDDGEEISGGSGTIIDPEGIVLTNSHVIPQDEEFILTGEEGCLVILPNQQTGQPEEMYWAKPVVIPELSDIYDLAYLEIYDVFVDEEDGEVYGKYPRTFPSVFAIEHKHDDICQFRSPKLGDPVRIFGYPQTSGGFYLTVTDGVISSFSDEGVILTSAKIDEGNSGGLAVDQKGCMVGVPVAISEGRYQNLGVIISTDLILEFFDELDKILDEQ